MCLLLALLACFLQICSLGGENWTIVSNSTVGLWRHCNYSNKEFTCCQPLDKFLTKSHRVFNIPAWVNAVRVFEVLGFVTTFVFVVSLITVIAVRDTKLKNRIRIFSIVISATAGNIILIGGVVYLQNYKEETWLGGAIPSSSLAISMATVLLLNICFCILFYSRKKIPRPVELMRSSSDIDSEWQMILINPTTPSYWNQFDAKCLLNSILNPTEKCKTTKASESEFTAVRSLVESTWESSKVGYGADARNIHTTSISVTDVKRVENIDLWENYVLGRKKIIKKILRDGPFKDLEDIPQSIGGPVMTSGYSNSALTRDLYPELNECYLFHGTKSQFVDNIMTKGIDPRHSGNNTMMGKGIYCAESSTKSDQYTDGKNHRLQVGLKMILVRMLLGKIFVANNAQQFKLPPCETCLHDNCTIQHHEHFDSVVVDIQNKLFREFIVYDAHQCYPEYIITYDRC